MTDRMFRLIELQQKLDTLIALARTRRFADPFEIATLKKRKFRIGARLARLLSPPTAAVTSL